MGSTAHDLSSTDKKELSSMKEIEEKIRACADQCIRYVSNCMEKLHELITTIRECYPSCRNLDETFRKIEQVLKLVTIDGIGRYSLFSLFSIIDRLRLEFIDSSIDCEIGCSYSTNEIESCRDLIDRQLTLILKLMMEILMSRLRKLNLARSDLELRNYLTAPSPYTDIGEQRSLTSCIIYKGMH